MVIDSSALVAILFDEPERHRFDTLIQADRVRLISAATLVEISIVIDSRKRDAGVAVDVAPDGSLYILDWHNPIIGHMQHNLRDPNRNKTYGRVYRVTYEGRPLLMPAKITGEPLLCKGVEFAKTDLHLADKETS